MTLLTYGTASWRDQESSHHSEHNWNKCCVARGGCTRREIAWANCFCYSCPHCFLGSTLGAALQDAPEPSQAHLHCGGSPPGRQVPFFTSMSSCCSTLWISCTHTPCFVVISKVRLAFSCLTVSGRWREARPVARTLHFPTLCCCPASQSSHGGLGRETAPQAWPAMSAWSGPSPSCRLSQTGLKDQFPHGL